MIPDWFAIEMKTIGGECKPTDRCEMARNFLNLTQIEAKNITPPP